MICLKLEKAFGLVSVAALGLIAMACVPNVKSEPNAPTKIEATEKLERNDQALMDDEIETIRQINEMNAHAGNEFSSGDIDPE